jgi:hypothetical protein
MIERKALRPLDPALAIGRFTKISMKKIRTDTSPAYLALEKSA